MAEPIVRDYFPSQTVSDLEKMTSEYGLRVAKAIEHEWFYSSSNRYSKNQQQFHKLRLYARGEQSIEKYKDELSINGDLSYLNLDWKPVPIIPKFVDIVVNGMSQRTYEVKAYSQDPYGVYKRTEYMQMVLDEMKLQDFYEFSEKALKVNVRQVPKDVLPDSEEELKLHMQLTYKQEVELAEEQAINVLMRGNNFDLTRRRLNYDLAVLGIAAIKTNFNTSEGVTIDYVDPANLVYSYSDSPYFEDIYYVGEVKSIPINELAKQFPELDVQQLDDIRSKNNVYNGKYRTSVYSGENKADKNKIQVLYFNYKTFSNDTYKVKTTNAGTEKAIPKPDTFNPPSDKEGDFTRLQRSIECLYEGAIVLGTDILLKWQKARNMMRPKSDYTKVKMNYAMVAPRMYNGKIESLVSRITTFADMIQLTHLKLQQVMSRMVPDGVYLDVDALAEVDLGNGTNYNPQEALNMFFQTGSIVGRSLNEMGDPSGSKTPIQEIRSDGGNAKLASLIQTYNYYLSMIRDVTGLNEARDGSTPDKNALVGVQKLAAANSNTATRHILQSSLFLTSQVAESLSLRISDILEYSPTRDAFIQAIGAHNVGTLDEMANLHLYDFGIFIELAPDEEEKAKLENNIQMALQAKLIDLEDAIDLREIKNVTLANQLLKIRRKKKVKRDQVMQQENIAAQAQANAQNTQAAAQSEMQKKNNEVQQELQLAEAKSAFKVNEMRQEVEFKKELMELEFNYNSQLTKMQAETIKGRETSKEDRKDERTRIQASQQSELINQRKQDMPPKKFESSGNDLMGGTGLDELLNE